MICGTVKNVLKVNKDNWYEYWQFSHWKQNLGCNKVAQKQDTVCWTPIFEKCLKVYPFGYAEEWQYIFLL
jgi:hypothetical protein